MQKLMSLWAIVLGTTIFSSIIVAVVRITLEGFPFLSI